VATIDVPASHHGIDRPDRKYSSGDLPARREYARATATVTAK